MTSYTQLVAKQINIRSPSCSPQSVEDLPASQSTERSIYLTTKTENGSDPKLSLIFECVDGLAQTVGLVFENPPTSPATSAVLSGLFEVYFLIQNHNLLLVLMKSIVYPTDQLRIKEM